MGRGGGETAGFGSRSFVSKEEDSGQFWLRPSLAEQHADDMIDAVRVGLVALQAVHSVLVLIPRTTRPIILPLTVEDYIQKLVHPFYGNTHTAASRVGAQSGWWRHEARGIIQSSCNASSEHDVVLFCGTGTTGAVHKLVSALQLSRYANDPRGAPVVFVSLFEHHSNMLPWREHPDVEVVCIDEDAVGRLDIQMLSEELKKYSARPLLIGSFSAASNVTGLLIDTEHVTRVLKQYGALSFWDYASAAPGMPLDMNPVDPQGASLAKDAAFFSPHKFAGGPGTPGVLIAKRSLWQNPVPSGHGGGSVFYVTAAEHKYLWQLEQREEGGTPGIIESIRAGLVLHVHRTVGAAQIAALEHQIASRALRGLSTEGCSNLMLLGSTTIERLPVVSFMVRHHNRYLHHNYVAVLLNDLFGIQARAGCACAGPYAQHLLGMDLALARDLEAVVSEDRTGIETLITEKARQGSGRELLRPGALESQLFGVCKLWTGFVRVSFHYTATESQIDYICKAVRMVANHGWKLLPMYNFDPETAEWTHREFSPKRLWLSDLNLSRDENGSVQFGLQTKAQDYDTGSVDEVFSLDEQEQYHNECLAQASAAFEQAAVKAAKLKHTGETAPTRTEHLSTRLCYAVQDETHLLDDRRETLRWFVYPSEGLAELLGDPTDDLSMPVFRVRSYNASMPTGPEAPTVAVADENLTQPPCPAATSPASSKEAGWKLIRPPKNSKLMSSMVKGIEQFGMIQPGDRVMIGVSGGKDSLSLVHLLKHYQQVMHYRGVDFDIAAVTIDPQADGFDPRPLKSYFAALGIQYFFEEQPILQLAKSQQSPINSICSFCARMKRGRLYAAMRREGYNVLALGQHLDDVSESFIMALFFNGVMRTIKANYTVAQGDLRVIRPLTFSRERDLRAFARNANLPVIDENCPACFDAPKERVRCKQLLAAQEHQTPALFNNLRAALLPCLAVDNARPDSQNPSYMINSSDDDETPKPQLPRRKRDLLPKKKKKKGGPKLGVRWNPGREQHQNAPNAVEKEVDGASVLQPSCNPDASSDTTLHGRGGRLFSRRVLSGLALGFALIGFKTLLR